MTRRTRSFTDARSYLEKLEPAELRATVDVLFSWRTWARPEQLEPPGDWYVWLIQAGRGWGKTRTAAEAVRARIDSGVWRVVNAAAPTWTDVWDTMVYGTEDAPGLARIWPAHQAPRVVRDEKNPHLRCWNGARIRLRAAQRAERFRGPQADGGWADEVDSWNPEIVSPQEAFSLFELGIRLGTDPRIIATSTPKRGRLVSSLRRRADCIVTRGSTRDNRENLAPQFLKMIQERYGGTRLGRQEIEGELLDDYPGALWTQEMLDAARALKLGDLRRIVVGVDPAATSTDDADETGIVVAGKDVLGRGGVLADHSCRLSPGGWAARAVRAYHHFKADGIVAEINNGGEMVEHTIRTVDANVPVTVVHGSRGKIVRAEPIAALCEQHKVAHVGEFPELEQQLLAMTLDGYVGDGSPDRADAYVWALTDLMLDDTLTGDARVW